MIPGRNLMALALGMGMLAFASAADWPQWRGPKRDGVWRQEGLPEQLPAKLTPRWKKPIGGGFGGIAVAGGRVYVMDRHKEPREIERVLCLDAKTGETIWEHSYDVAYGKLDYGNGPRTTPTVRNGRVYTYGAVGHLCCLDAVTGKVIWSKDTVQELKGRYPTWGHSCSPLLDENRLLVQVGAPDGCLFALDPATGKEIWRSMDDRPGYSSPLLVETRHGPRLFYWTAQHVVGLDRTTGKVLWKSPFEINYDVAITDLVFHDEILLASNYWTGSKAFAFDEPDKPRIVWEGKQLSMLMSTPLTRDGHVYAIDRFRGLKCLEIKTGKVCWEGEYVVRRGDSNPHATLAWVGERALIFNEDGDLFLASLTPEALKRHGKSSAFPSKGRVWAHPAFADGCLFARDNEAIACIPLVE